MTKILFVRHGEALHNTTPERIGGRSNHVPLTERGMAQAAVTGAYLREQGVTFDAAYSSGAVRADQTATGILLAACIDLPITIDERLQEVSQGEWEGQLREDVYTPQRIAEHRLNDIDGHLPTAESVRDGQQRIDSFVTDLYLRHPDQR